MGKNEEMKDMVQQTEKRDVGEVRVLRPEDLATAKNLIDRVDKMVENRCEVFMHNVAFLCKKHNLSQAQLCSAKLGNLLSPPQLTGYKKRGKDIPLRVMTLVATAFDLTVEELCGQVLDGVAEREEERAALTGRPLQEYRKYHGTFSMAYFDTSKALGRDDAPTVNRLERAIMTVYTTYNAIGVPSFHVTAIFNCSEDERRKVLGYMAGIDLGRDASEVRDCYEKALSSSWESESSASRLKCLYDGEISLNERMTEITLRQVRGNDVVHMLAHNRAATSSEGKDYRGGLFTMMSVSRGEEHMPCVQLGLVVREKVTKDAAANQRCPLDSLQPETLASKLYLASPVIGLDQQIPLITEYMKSLFLDDGENASLARMSNEDKEYCLASFLEKKMTDTLWRNILSYYKLPLASDSEVYKLIGKQR